MSMINDYEQAREEIGQFLENMAGKLRPVDTTDVEDETEITQTNSVIQEWMVLITWSDLETGDSYTSWVSPNMIPSHQVGLLTTVSDAIRAL